jgi:hypothetical protein
MMVEEKALPLNQKAQAGKRRSSRKGAKTQRRKEKISRPSLRLCAFA